MKSDPETKGVEIPVHPPETVTMSIPLRILILVLIWMTSLNVYAANYSLPADIGTGAFASCSVTTIPNYTCTAKVQLNNNDTVVLTSDVTLNIDPEFKVKPGASASNGGFVFNVFVTGKIHIDGTGSVEINLTATGEIKIHKASNITGNITSTGGDVLIEDDGSTIVGDVTAAGILVIEGTSSVDGTCSPTHPKCTGGGGGSGPGAVCTTTQIATNGEEFRGISGSSDSNVIAVGKNGSIYHYDGTSWTKNAFTSNEDLRDIEVVNSNLAFAVGKNGKVVQYDGAVWSTLPAPTGEDLEGVWAISSTEVWVAGKNNALYLWNGTSWTDMSGAGQANVDNGSDLKDAWGNSSSFYTVEKDGDLYRYTRTGGPWSKLNACNTSFDMDANDIWGDGAGNIYIAGKDRGANPKEAAVFLYNEGTNSCSKLFSTTTEDKLEGISGNGSVVYGVGKKGLILDNSSGTWSESTQGSEDFKDVWVSSSGIAYYAGKNGFVTVCSAPASTIDHFRISPATVNASTCLPNAITIIAEDSSNNPVANYSNQIDIMVSSNHGNWSINSANGVLSPNPDNDDDGAVSYTFVNSDVSQIVLNLSNTHTEGLTITVTDAVEAVSSTSVPISYSDNVFVITEDPVQIAGRPQAMNIAMWTNDGSNCFVDTNYDYGPHSLEASINRGGVLPAAADPTIAAATIPDGPATATISLDFSIAPGQADFSLDTTDVGQYTLTISDISNTHGTAVITGSSSQLTVRPFGIAVNNIVAGATANPGGTAPGDPVFTAAGSDFAADVAGVLWDAADDTNNDGVLDTGVYANNSVAPSYAWDTTLSVSAAGFTPATGAPGALNNATVLLAEFTGGSFNVVDLQYTEVGSFTLQPVATDFLGEITADIVGDDIIVGRFIPASFQVAINSNGVLGDTCTVYTYMGENFSYSTVPAITVTALSALGATTTNYRDGFVKLTGASVSVDASQDDTTVGSDSNPLLVSYAVAAMAVTPNNDGTVSYSFGADTYRYGPDTPVSFSKFPNSQVAPFVADINPEITAVSDAEVTSNFPPMTYVLDPTGNNLRFARLRMTNTHGSELNPLLMPAVTEFWNGTGFQVNVLDTCTTISSADLVSVASPPGLSVPAIINSPALAGDIGITFPAPGAGNDGYIDTTTDLSSSGDLWLRFDWDNDNLFDNDPIARATFGIFSGNPVNIYLQQIYQ